MANKSTERDNKWLAAWYHKRRWVYWLLPLEILFRLVSAVRRFAITRFWQKRLAVPVVIVGNISVGGTGKTPLLIALVKHLQQQGLTVGVISRGYGSQAPEYPYVLCSESSATQAGDEPLSIWRATGCAVCIDANRVAAAYVLQNAGCDILLSDDGLQHYRLGRAIEIAVVDAARGFGNNHCLPVGPLREPRRRLQQVDFVIVNQTAGDGDHLTSRALNTVRLHNMRLQPVRWQRVNSAEPLPLENLARGTRVHAVAGIGHPQRFFDTLTSLGLQPQCHIYRDHHHFCLADFQFTPSLPVVMTSKDAVKCQHFAADHWLALEVEAVVDKRFWSAFDRLLAPLVNTPKPGSKSPMSRTTDNDTP